ncbi:hypothetical protein D3C72_1011840 [compost metagenome]
MLFKSGRMAHHVQHRNRPLIAKLTPQFFREASFDILIQLHLPLLHQLHYRGPDKHFVNGPITEYRPGWVYWNLLLYIGISVTLGEDDPVPLGHHNSRSRAGLPNIRIHIVVDLLSQLAIRNTRRRMSCS